MVDEKKNGQDDNDSGYSEEEALFNWPKKRTKAQNSYRKANAAIIPDFIPPEERKDSDCVLRENQVFTTNHGLSEKQVWRFVCQAATYGFNMEQALALLHVNKYNLDEANADLKVYTQLPSQWPEDRSVFVHALKEEEKYFLAIKDRFFPNRTTAHLVEYYYLWKMEKKRRKIRQILKMKMKLKQANTNSQTVPQRNTTKSA